MRKGLITLSALIVLLGGAAEAFAQAAGSSGEIKGQIADQTGAVLPGVSVTATESQRGISRSVVTNEAGQYLITLLPPGVYEVRASLAGFATRIVKGVQLTVGQTVTLDMTLEVSELATEVVVTGEAALVELERTQQSNTIDERYIDYLPINRRNYLSFSLLTPGVTDTTSLADNTDFRVVQTPHTGLSFYGSNGRGNSIQIDGAENNVNSGGVRSAISQEAVQEFQINRSNYSAEFGGASGGVINIVTKSGSNELRGSIFAFFRDDALDARDPFAVGFGGVPIDPPFSRQQYGGSLGFPFKKDKTFFFGAFEKLNRDERASVPILTDPNIFLPTASQNELLNFLAGAPTPSLRLLASGLRVPLTTTFSPQTACSDVAQFPQRPAPSSVTFPRTVKLFCDNTGVFPFTTNFTTFSTRIDHRFSESDNIFFRTNYTNQFNANSLVRSLVGVSRGSVNDNVDGTAIFGHNHIFSPRAMNEFRFQWSYTNDLYIPNDPLGPEINIAGFGFFNRDIFLPSFTIERRYQWIDNFLYTKGKHKIKMGLDINIIDERAESHTFFPGRFNFGESIPLGAILDSAAGRGTTAGLIAALATPTAQGGLGRPDLICTLVDDPRCASSQFNPRGFSPFLSALQAFNLGLPEFYQQGFGNPTVEGVPVRWGFYAQDTWNVTPNFTLNFGLRYELDNEPDPLNLDTNNFAPRFGFSWDPFGDKKTVLRGGYGIFYAPHYFQIVYVVNALNVIDGFNQIAQVFVPLTGVPGVNNPATGQPLTSADIFRTLSAQGVIGSRQITPADLRQFGINVRQTLPLAPLSVIFPSDPDYANAYSQHISFGLEREVAPNLSIAADYIFVRGLKITRARDINIVPSNLRNRIPRTDITVPQPLFRNPLLLQENIYESSARSFYHGFTLSLIKRYSRHVSFNINYTLSKAIDEVTDFNSDFQPNDQTNINAERALSGFDQRHRFVVSAVLESPFSGRNALSYLLGGWTLSPVIVASSARPFNLLLGFDANRDRHSTTDRPPRAGRNMGRGPDFVSVDLRVTRRINLGDEGRRNVELFFEAFNLFNRLNFSSVNNVVGTSLLQPPFDVRGRKDRKPTEPLGFTSASDPRQIQLGFRLNF